MAYYPASTMVQHYHDPSTGELLSGGFLSARIAGTSTPTAMYSDAAGSASDTEIELNSAGEPQFSNVPSVIYLDPAIIYDFVLEKADRSSRWTIEDITTISGLGDLGDSSSVARGDALVAVKRTFTGAVATTLHAWIEAQAIQLVADLQANAAGSVDVTAKIQAALDAGYDVDLPHGTFLVSDELTIPTTSARPITIRGAGMGNTALIRATAYVAGDIFYATTLANPFSGWLTIKDLSIINGNGANNTSGAAIHINARDCVTLENIFIYDGFLGVYTNGGCGYLHYTNVIYFQSSTYATTYGVSDAGFRFEDTISASFMLNCFAGGQNVTTANVVQGGLIIRGADGLQITNSAFSGRYGIILSGGDGTNIDDVYFSNCVVDGCRNVGVYLQGNNAPNVYTNIRFVGCHINPRIDSAQNTVGVLIEGDCDYVQFIGGNINESGIEGVAISNVNSYLGVPRESIKFNGVDITGNNRNSVAGGPNVRFNTGVTGVSMTDCEIFNRPGSIGDAFYAIAFEGSNSDIRVIDCKLMPNTTAPLFFGGTAPTELIIKDNMGLNNVVDTVASAATITVLGKSDIIHITGTTTIDTINGGWIGRTVLFYVTDGAVTFSAAGNNAVSKSVADEDAILLTYDGTKWRACR
jgi:hypothetical protein